MSAESSSSKTVAKKPAPFLEGLFDDPKIVKFSPDNPRGIRAAPFVTDVAEFMKTRKVDDLLRVLNDLYTYVIIFKLEILRIMIKFCDKYFFCVIL